MYMQHLHVYVCHRYKYLKMWTYCWVSPLPAGSVSSLQSPPVVASGSTHPSSHARWRDGVLRTHTGHTKPHILQLLLTGTFLKMDWMLHWAMWKNNKNSTVHKWWKTMFFFMNRERYGAQSCHFIIYQCRNVSYSLGNIRSNHAPALPQVPSVIVAMLVL